MQQKDAVIFTPMLCARDLDIEAASKKNHDPKQLVVIGLTQTSNTGGIAMADDTASRSCSVIVHVYDPATGVLMFIEFERFIDSFTVDIDNYGCLMNGGARQKALLKEYRVLEASVTFSEALLATKGAAMACLDFEVPL